MPLFRRIAKPILCLLLTVLLAGCGLPAVKKEKKVFSVAYVAEQGLSLFREGEQPVLLREGKNFARLCFSGDGQYIFFNESSDLFCYSLAEGKRKLAAKNAKAVCFDQKGRLIAYSPAEATAYDPATGESEVLYTPPEGVQLAGYLPSPDETRAAYSLFREDAGQKIPLGFFVTIPGSEEVLQFTAEEISGKRLYLPVPLAWATDGSGLLVAAGPGNGGRASLYTVPITDGAPVPLSKKYDLLIDGIDAVDVHLGGGQALLPVLKNEGDEFYSLLQIDLFSFSFSLLYTSTSVLTGLDISRDGEMAAYTAEGSGLFTLWSGKTAQIAGAAAGQTFHAPRFSKDRQQIYFLSQKESSVEFCVAAANSAGFEPLFSGILPPKTALGQRFSDMFAVYEP